MKLEGDGGSALNSGEGSHEDPFRVASGYHQVALDVMNALSGDQSKRIIVNTQNQGDAEDLAGGCCAEVRDELAVRAECHASAAVLGRVYNAPIDLGRSMGSRLSKVSRALYTSRQPSDAIISWESSRVPATSSVGELDYTLSHHDMGPKAIEVGAWAYSRRPAVSYRGKNGSFLYSNRYSVLYP
jgi:hypothetical protein